MKLSSDSSFGDKKISAAQIIEKLNLEPLACEGGYFRRTYESDVLDNYNSNLKTGEFEKKRNASAIYYLVTPESFSALHKIESDEIYHFYLGDPLEMVQIDETGKLQKIVIGADILKDESLQVLVPKNVWQGTKLVEGGAWALIGTTCSPEFKFDDFALADRAELSQKFPQLKYDIIRFTRELNRAQE